MCIYIYIYIYIYLFGYVFVVIVQEVLSFGFAICYTSSPMDNSIGKGMYCIV